MSKNVRLPLACLIFTYTASGAVLGFLSLVFMLDRSFDKAFWMLFVATMIDYTDGSLGRYFNIYSILPILDISKMDSVIDFVTNGLAPALLLLVDRKLPFPAHFWASLILLISLFRYSKSYDSAIERGLFTGLPVFWMFYAFYAFYLKMPPWVSALIILCMSLLAFTRLQFVHVARFKPLRLISSVGLFAWWAVFLLVTQGRVENPNAWVLGSLVYPLYYICVSAAANRLLGNER